MRIQKLIVLSVSAALLLSACTTKTELNTQTTVEEDGVAQTVDNQTTIGSPQPSASPDAALSAPALSQKDDAVSLQGDLNSTVIVEEDFQ